MNVLGLLVDVENAVAAASTDDQANVYAGANREGHFVGSESSEKCAPVAGNAVNVHGSIGNAPAVCVAAAVAEIGLAPQASLAKSCDLVPRWFH